MAGKQNELVPGHIHNLRGHGDIPLAGFQTDLEIFLQTSDDVINLFRSKVRVSGDNFVSQACRIGKLFNSLTTQFEFVSLQNHNDDCENNKQCCAF
jgi:hypothetical protein